MPPEEPREPPRGAELERPPQRQDVDTEALPLGELGERPALGRDEADLVPAFAGRAREP